MKDLISVIVPVYNVEVRYPNALSNCLTSLKNQTYNKLEIILVDDGSTDSSSSICDNYAENDSRFKVFHTENKGISAARNYGIKKAHGDYIFFSDDDDCIHSQCLDVMFKMLNEHPDCDIVRGGVQLDDKPFSQIIEPKYSVCESNYMIKSILNGKMLPCMWNQLIRRNIIETVKFRETTFEDMDFNVRAYLLAKNILCLDDITYKWVQHDISESHRNKIKRFYGKLKSLEFLYFNDIKSKHSEYAGPILWYTYAFYLNEIMENKNRMELEFNQMVFEKFKSFYNKTKEDFMTSDAPLAKKIVLPIMIKFPRLKRLSLFYHKLMLR